MHEHSNTIRRLTIFAVAMTLGIAACGGSDSTSDADTGEPTPDTSSTDLGDTQLDAPTDGGEVDAEAAGVFDPAVVRACLSDAGYETVSSSELLSEQQVQDSLTAFGQTDGLTFDASTVAFAGGVTFFVTPELAEERGQDFADVAKAQRIIGNAMINVSAGSDFDDAIAAAEACLGE